MENEVEGLGNLLAGCMKYDRKYQKLLYKSHYGFAMGICLRYASNRREATEIMNKGFLKVFLDIQKYDFQKPFKAWLRRMMINAAIDYYRLNLNELTQGHAENKSVAGMRPLAEGNWGYKELLVMVQQLPHRLRLIYNLYAIEAYTYQEISKMIGESEGTCKFHLLKAREILRQMILETD